MRLAEALMERADLKKKIAQMSDRMIQNAKVYEDEEPMEDMSKLLRELDRITERYEDLMWKINLANATNRASNGEPLVELIARREAYISKDKALRDMLASLKTDRHDYYGNNDRKRVVKIDVPAIRKQTDSIAKRIREIDALNQEANWNITV